MSAEDVPQINLDFSTAFCARHLEPFRAEWPKGAALAMVGLVSAALSDPRIHAMAVTLPDGKKDASQLDALISEHTPLCCFIAEDLIAEITMLSLRGEIWKPDPEDPRWMQLDFPTPEV